MLNRVKELIRDGSDTYQYTAGIIAAGAIAWVEVRVEFPAARTYEPLDYLEVINNSAQPITVYHEAISGVAETVPAYMIKPFSRRPFRRFALLNAGAGNTVAGEVICKMRRMKPDVESMISLGTKR